MQVVENQPIMWSVLTSGCFGRTIENRRCFLAEVRVARPKPCTWMQMKQEVFSSANVCFMRGGR